MATALKFIAPRVPLTEPASGLITREWYLFLQGLFNIANGSGSDLSLDDVEALVAMGYDGAAMDGEILKRIEDIEVLEAFTK